MTAYLNNARYRSAMPHGEQVNPFQLAELGRLGMKTSRVGVENSASSDAQPGPAIALSPDPGAVALFP